MNHVVYGEKGSKHKIQIMWPRRKVGLQNRKGGRALP